MKKLPLHANDAELIAQMARDPEVQELRRQMISVMAKYKYSYNWTWYGRPIIQLPSDVVAVQELILAIQPRVIVETGVAHGGSLVLSASMLELIGEGVVVGIDVDIRRHNRIAIEAHPLSKRIRLIQGSSIDSKVVDEVKTIVGQTAPVMVFLDSNHTHEHVLRELELYSPLVTSGSYLVVFDTIVEDMLDSDFSDRPWGPGNSPKTAVREFLKGTDRFAVDHEIEDRLLFTVAPEGYLRCIK